MSEKMDLVDNDGSKIRHRADKNDDDELIDVSEMKDPLLKPRNPILDAIRFIRTYIKFFYVLVMLVLIVTVIFLAVFLDIVEHPALAVEQFWQCMILAFLFVGTIFLYIFREHWPANILILLLLNLLCGIVIGFGMCTYMKTLVSWVANNEK